MLPQVIVEAGQKVVHQTGELVEPNLSDGEHGSRITRHYS